MTETPANDRLIQVRKYPNRRLYDQSRSRHLTHEELYDLVVSGHSVVVTDSRTGQDITNVVLAQVLIERDPVKLAAFPSAMLHQLIRTNEQILHSFITRYFNQVMESFLAMRQQFEAMLPQQAQAMPLTPFDWAMAVMRASGPRPSAPTAPPPPAADVTELQEQIESLQTELAGLRKRSSKKSASKKPAAPKPRRRVSTTRGRKRNRS